MAARFWKWFPIYGTITFCNYQKHFRTQIWNRYIWSSVITDFLILKPTSRQKRAAELEVVEKVIGAEKSIKEGNLKRADLIMDGVLDFAKNRKVEKGVSSALYMLASIAFLTGKYNDSIKLLNNELALFNKNVPKDDNRILLIKLKLARIHDAQNDNRLAENLYRQCCSLWRSKLSQNLNEEQRNETLDLYISGLFWFSRFLQKIYHYEYAKKLLFELMDEVEINRMKYDTNLTTQQRMLILYQLAHIAYLQNKFRDSVIFLQKAISLGLPNGDPELAVYYNRVSFVYFKNGQLENAHHWGLAAQEIAKNSKNTYEEKNANNLLKKIMHQIILTKQND